VNFRLAGTSPATLEVIDVTGRRVFSRRFDVFAMESPNVAVERAGDGFPAGVYFVRLTQAGRSVQARAVILK